MGSMRSGLESAGQTAGSIKALLDLLR